MVAVIGALALAAVPVAQAAPADLDPDFGDGDGKATTDIGDPEGEGDAAYGIAIQADGKIIAVGGSTVSPVETDFALARYNTDGSLDPTFGEGDGIVRHEFGCDCAFTDVVVQPDGKIVAVGHWTQMFVIARYNTDGSLDPTFGGGDGIVTNDFGLVAFAQAIALLGDGKMVVAGSAGLEDQDFALARYNSDGTLDTGFGGGDGMVTKDFGGDDVATALVLLADGKILVGGDNAHWEDESFEAYVADFVLARYNADGTLDSAFGGGDGKAVTDFDEFDGLSDLALQPDGRILAVGGQAHEEPDESYVGEFAIARYNANGTLDSAFGGGDGKASASFAQRDHAVGVALQSDGRFVVVGSARDPEFGTGDFAVTRFNPNGTLDGGFGTGGQVTTDFGPYDYAVDVALASDGRIVAVGSGNWEFALARYKGGGPPPAQRTLTVNVAGDGSVSSSPPGIDCESPSCTASFYDDEIVKLYPTAGAGWFVLGWSWPGSGPGCVFDESVGDPCIVTMTGDAEVTAEFSYGSGGEGPPSPPDDDSADEGDSESTASPPPSPPEALAPIAPAPHGVGVANKVVLVKGPIALLPLRCAGQGPCRGVAKLFIRVNRGKGRTKRTGARRSAARKRSKRLLVIGKGRFAVAPGKRRSVRIRLTRAGKRLVKKAGRRGLRARLVGPGLRKRGVKLRPTPSRKGKKMQRKKGHR